MNQARLAEWIASDQCSTVMPRLNLLSSAIKVVDYDAATKSLEIELTTGRAYRYLDVPPSVFDALLAAGSKGRFYNDHIRDVYLYERLR